MKNYVLILSFLLLGFYSCNKEDDAFAPPITAENTFSCKIDGELFVPKDHGGFIPLYGYLIEILEDNSWIITLSNGKNTLYLFIKKINNTGNYEVFASDGDQDFLYNEKTGMEFTDNGNNIEYISLNNSENIEILSYTNGQKLILKFDKIVLGSTTNNASIILTDGKLNINKETLNKDQ
ncbi:hypothetical protein FK178_04425 [Antarcticibacterium arcticum]|uniref:Uncharacterized protein n=1 Tax=Antarcticibacterium arcticum TaxID=2585771 RepID=A0A5B8YGJ7_9FLAO|nr:hypothetical protein [Antarcticibacterium arcticum]QED37000.1 hypothetical protein FK178_04425 [Antarcticibacterium arcticum]